LWETGDDWIDWTARISVADMADVHVSAATVPCETRTNPYHGFGSDVSDGSSAGLTLHAVVPTENDKIGLRRH
jgi:hypothetical protein